MFLTYFKIIAAFLTLAIVAASSAVIYRIYERQIQPTLIAQKSIEQIAESVQPQVDLGIRDYNTAISLIRAGEMEKALVPLKEIITRYRDSAYFNAARRIVGEHNVDTLLSRDPMQGKTEYIVQRGDSFSRIASRTNSTVGYLLTVNNRMGLNLQPGEQLIATPLEFRVVVHTKSKLLELRKDDAFFKIYPLEGIRFPSGTASSFDTTIKSKAAFAGSNPVLVDKESYVGAEKIINLSRNGVSFRYRASAEAEDPYFTGVFLSRENIEELIVLLRNGMKVNVRPT